MPHLHLPIDHTDADVVLAANVADVVGSADLYVTWSHMSGPGAVPEVEAVVREERSAGRIATFFAGIAAFWLAITRRPPHAPTERTAVVEAPPRTSA
jgi:hypothetical protein